MKFKVQTSDWTSALSLASSVNPSAVDSQGTAGYLCVVRGEKCFLYSEDGKQRLRVSIPVFDVDGEGAFVYPTGSQGDLRYVDGWVEFETGEDGGAYVVWCRRDTGGAKGGVHKIVTFAPNILKALDADLSSAEKTSSFPVVVLKEALGMTRPYLETKEQDAKPEFQNLQLFGSDTGEEGNGFLLGFSMNKTSYFYSPDLEGKSLTVYLPRISLLQAFLAKSSGYVHVYRSENSTYFMNSDEQVLGWSNQAFTMSKFGYYGFNLDRHVLRIPKAILEKELKYIRSTLPPDKNKAFWFYDHKAGTITISASNTFGSEVDSVPIAATPLVPDEDERCWGPGDLGSTVDVQCNVNLELLIPLVEATKHPRDIILGIAIVKGGKQHIFRVVEEYSIDQNGKYVEKPVEGQEVYQCHSVRYVPSKH